MSPSRFRSTAFLSAALLAVCYIADWTDDYCGYEVSNQYSTFESANAHKPPLSGANQGSLTLAFVALRLSVNATQETTSPLDAVFGSPNRSSANDDSSPSSLSPFDRPSAATGGLTTSSNGFGTNRVPQSNMWFDTSRTGSSIGSTLSVSDAVWSGRTSLVDSQR